LSGLAPIFRFMVPFTSPALPAVVASGYTESRPWLRIALTAPPDGA